MLRSVVSVLLGVLCLFIVGCVVPLSSYNSPLEILLADGSYKECPGGYDEYGLFYRCFENKRLFYFPFSSHTNIDTSVIKEIRPLKKPQFYTGFILSPCTRYSCPDSLIIEIH